LLIAQVCVCRCMCVCVCVCVTVSVCLCVDAAVLKNKGHLDGLVHTHTFMCERAHTGKIQALLHPMGLLMTKMRETDALYISDQNHRSDAFGHFPRALPIRINLSGCESSCDCFNGYESSYGYESSCGFDYTQAIAPSRCLVAASCSCQCRR
jgi:hypothetical protein